MSTSRPLSVFLSPIRALGETGLGLVELFGDLAILAWETIISLCTAKWRWNLVLEQLWEIGSRSQLVVVITGAFTGAVFAAQTFFQFNRVGMDSAVGAVVVVAMFRELGPVLTGLMLSGRVGASIAAEIGTMKVTEQLDALRALGVHPIDYLVVPRVIAIYISMPLLVLEAIAFGIVAAWIVGVQLLEIPAAPFWTNIVRYNTFNEILYALIKGAFFAAVIVLTACHHGLAARNGAAGVGRAPTEAVVGGSLGILMMNFILSVLLNALLTESQG